MALRARGVLTVMELVNERTGTIVAGEIEVASTRITRRRGLLGRQGMDLTSALVIAPCWSIHTCGMRFSIDVLFVDAGGAVMRAVRRVPPWRVAFAPGACAAIELAAGAADLRGVMPGDRLYARSGDGFTSSAFLFGSPSFLRMAAKPACSGS